MMIRNTIETWVREALKKAFPDVVVDRIAITHPERLEHGDYTTNIAMQIAKQVGKPPRAVAEAIIAAGEHSGILVLAHQQPLVSSITIAGAGYINFFLSDAWLAHEADTIVKAGSRYGAQSIGEGKTIVIDLAGPNIAKEMSVGHLRSTIIGDAVANLHAALGYRVVRDNHVGDWGTQFGKLIVAVRDAEARGTGSVATLDLLGLMALYVQFHKDAEADATLEERARAETKKLQDGDPENVALWKLFLSITKEDHDRIYARLGVTFDTERGESFYNSMLQATVDHALKTGVATESAGAVVIKTSDRDGEAPFMIQKSDKAFGYQATDLATIQKRVEEYQPEKILYVVGNEQSQHFAQLFLAARKLGLIDDPAKLVHVKFGLLLDTDGKKFSTRKGKIVSLHAMLDEAVARAGQALKKDFSSSFPRKRESTESGPILDTHFRGDDENKKTAEIVGIGALKYFDLSQVRTHDIQFSWDRMLSLTGNSAPYLQYVAVRIQSIKMKATEVRATEETETTGTERHATERALYQLVYRLPEVIEDAAAAYEPHRLAEYLYTLASHFHAFYEQVPVLKAPPDIRDQRLALLGAVRQALSNGLTILGIRIPDRM